MISAHNTDILPQKDRDSAQSKARSGQTREGFIQRWRLTALMKPPALNYRKLCLWTACIGTAWWFTWSLTETAPASRVTHRVCRRTKNSHHDTPVVLVPFLDWTLDGGLSATIFVSCLVGQRFGLFGLSWERAGDQPWVFPGKTAHLHREKPA